MGVVNDDGVEVISTPVQADDLHSKALDEKHVDSIELDASDAYSDIPADKPFVPDENDEVIDPRLKDYPIPLVAKTVDLYNDETYVPLATLHP